MTYAEIIAAIADTTDLDAFYTAKVIPARHKTIDIREFVAIRRAIRAEKNERFQVWAAARAANAALVAHDKRMRAAAAARA
jgi:hypothetical protein